MKADFLLVIVRNVKNKFYEKVRLDLVKEAGKCSVFKKVSRRFKFYSIKYLSKRMDLKLSNTD
ncbi:hypothetical protein BpHYR1_039619 [Brachionus plicatilis]|uniref:Uncharacterized protein n=1 Tax=Brachionus plicatilis TaxID=10195 RepID=A0A3M7SZT6_BRAPC|nr:hypothetical protein BpHYR1_039619 [Brachionus plicatilis]